MVELAETIWADGPSSVPSNPPKVKIRAWGKYIENGIAGAAAGATIYNSYSALEEDTSQAANAMAWVLGDATAANNGVYQFDGTDTWTRLGDLPYSYIMAANAGAGTADAIVATTSIPIPEADGAALIALPIVADNTSATVTVAFNGGTALTVKDVAGSDPRIGDLRAGMILSGYVSGSTFRYLNTFSTQFIRAANDGAGTANAIQATTDHPLPSGRGDALIALPIVADNTASPVTVAFNGASALTIKTSSGNDIAVGGLASGMIVAGYVSGTTFRLLSDQASASIQAAAEAAKDATLAAMSSVIPNTFATKTVAETYSPDVAPDFINLTGYGEPGDGRGFLAVKTAADPGHGAAFQITLSDGVSKQWYTAADLSRKVAWVLWTGQSNASQPYDHSDTADARHPNAMIWDGVNGWVSIAAGKGGISADATNHSLFNLTRLLIEEGGYVEVRVIFEAVGGRPIAEWSGTPDDRTISEANTPRMWGIKTQFEASGSAPFTHVFMVQGEANASDPMLPATDPSTYVAQREFFRQSLVDQGFADAETRWIESEVLHQEVAAGSWMANRGINWLDTLRDNVAIVSTDGFLGQDEGHVFNFQGTDVPYTLHFSPEENSELGRRCFTAAMSLAEHKPARVDHWQSQGLTPNGMIGRKIPTLFLDNQTIELSSRWARDGVVQIKGTCNVTLLADDMHVGQVANAGNRITFRLMSGSQLNLTTEIVRIYQYGEFTNTITRKAVAAPRNAYLTLDCDGSNWYIMNDLVNWGLESSLFWEERDGMIQASGLVAISRSVGTTVSVAFPPDMPPIANLYNVAVDGACAVINKTAAGFDLMRTVTVDAAAPSQAFWVLHRGIRSS